MKSQTRQTPFQFGNVQSAVAVGIDFRDVLGQHADQGFLDRQRLVAIPVADANQPLSLFGGVNRQAAG
jgi:hypothetical protein